MSWPPRFHSLLAQFTLRVIAPLALIVLAILGAGLYIYQQTITSLVVDRDRQLAALSAAQLAEAMTRYARELETLASSPDILDTGSFDSESLDASLRIFTAGIVVVASDGLVLHVTPPGASPVGDRVASQAYFTQVERQLVPVFSQVLLDARTGQLMIVIAVPIWDEAHAFAGALLGAVDLDNTTFTDPIAKLKIGDTGQVYLVDGTGRVIFHPDTANIGSSFTDRPFVTEVASGRSGGTLWQSQTGEQVVIGYAPVATTGWGLIVREPWSAVVRPVQIYGVFMVLGMLVAAVLAAYWLWLGVRRIAVPINTLVEQTVRLAAGESVEPVILRGVDEIETLERAFNQMATQIASYRAGLRRYVDAITQSQEDERRRISRELHDETIQSLLTIARRLELYQASETDPARLERLVGLHGLINDTMQGVRQISRDLRPLILEDLGLIPALRALLSAKDDDGKSRTQTKLEIKGHPINLGSEHELALYRITQEALTNIDKHAFAKNTLVELTFEALTVHLTIRDDGIGFSVPASFTELAQKSGFGLIGIQERVWALEGSLAIQSSEGQGTCIQVNLPIVQ